MTEDTSRESTTRGNQGIEDPELRRVLRLWEAPAVPASLDERMLASFQRQTAAPWWRRLFTASVPVPLPVAVAVLLLLLVSAAIALRRPVGTTPEVQQTADVVRSVARLDAPVVTHTSLAGFQPVADMNVTVVSGGH
jgi:hypothetical protein